MIDKRIKTGTKVKLDSFSKHWFTVESVHVTKKWIEVNGLVGSFQNGHILNFKNDQGKRNK
jgi:hypothetical protein